MNCTFFGHRNATDEVKASLKNIILYLVEKEHIERFLVGNNGNFDFYAQCVLQELKNEGRDICYDIILSRVGEKALSDNQNNTLFPEELENTIPKYTISKRNDWLIKSSNILIAYVKHNFSNSGKWMEKAQKRGLKVINLAGKGLKQTFLLKPLDKRRFM